MRNILTRFFRRLYPEFPKPYASLATAMRNKDPELYKHIGALPVEMALVIWGRKYPEDFPTIKREAA